MDSNIFDKIVDTPGALQLVETLVADGKVELLVTHVQEDELARIPDEQRRQRVALVPRTIAPTYGFVLDMSRLVMARFGEAAPIEAIRGGNWPKYTHDALIAATAHGGATEAETDGARLARMSVDEVAAAAINSLPGGTWDQGVVELGRRLIHSLEGMRSSSETASRRLMWATVAIGLLTAVLVALTIVEGI